MITRRLVLVLGAGASMPYGFPSGRGLKMQIISSLEPGTDSPMFRQLRDADFPTKQIGEFQNALKKSAKQSVDSFLEHRIEFLKVGKAAIACALIPMESEQSFFSDNRWNWYEYFFNRLNARFEEFDKNSVSVLTFNYDRSLEHYLFIALKNAYGKTEAECAAKLHSVPIVHLYGHLGELPYLAAGGLEYGAIVNPENLMRCLEGIQIIHEDIGSSRQFQRAHDLLRLAERICFLGFGYDSTNLERLMAYGPTSEQDVWGSAKDLTDRECLFINRKLKALGCAAGKSNLDNISEDSLEALKNYCAFDWE